MVLSLAFSLYGIPRTAFNPDESRWIHRAHYLGALRDPFGPTWDDQYLTRGQPPLGSIMTGLGLVLQGRDLTTNGSWDFDYDAATNAELGNMPSTDDLQTARRTSAMLVALTVAAVYLIGTRVTNWLGGLIGALIFAVHPFSAYIGSLATSDALFGLLIALAGLAALRLAERPSWPRAIVLGILLGLGGATKLSPLLLAVPVACFGILLLVLAKREGQRSPLGWHLLSVPITSALTFVAVYPYLWPDPIGRTLNLFRFRIVEMATQSSDWPVMAVPTRAEALARIGINFEERFSIPGGLEAIARNLTGTELSLPRPELPLAIAGLLVLIALAIRHGLTSQPMVALGMLGGQVGITVMGMRSEFDRYHLPMAILAAVCISVLSGTLAMAVRRRVESRQAAPATTRQDPIQSGPGRPGLLEPAVIRQPSMGRGRR